jgi:hypothetical protein
MVLLGCETLKEKSGRDGEQAVSAATSVRLCSSVVWSQDRHDRWQGIAFTSPGVHDGRVTGLGRGLCWSALVTAAILFAPPAASARLTITVARGADGARLDMNRGQVVARLGPPVWHSGAGVLSYQRPEDGIFDVYRYPDTRRVRMFTFAPGPPSRRRAWRLRDGNRIFTGGGVRRLRQHFGHRVHRWVNPETGDRNWVICSRYHHRPVRTEFLVGSFAPDRLVSDVTILFIDRAADGSPLAHPRCRPAQAYRGRRTGLH